MNALKKALVVEQTKSNSQNTWLSKSKCHLTCVGSAFLLLMVTRREPARVECAFLTCKEVFSIVSLTCLGLECTEGELCKDFVLSVGFCWLCFENAVKIRMPLRDLPPVYIYTCQHQFFQPNFVASAPSANCRDLVLECVLS